ncbi:hypothetical protein [Marinobacter sp. NP-4(2019)]|nr:hypothetical protein [Marinobacter sp. NP-4(2019)]
MTLAILLVVMKNSMQMPDSEGHFYYAEPSEAGNERRRKLAEELYQVGVR